MSFLGKKKNAVPAAVSQVPPPVTIMSEASATPDEARKRAMLRAQSRRGFAASVRGGESNSGSSYQSSTGVRSLLGVP